MVVISCVSGATGSNLAMIWGGAWKIDFTLKDEQFNISHTFLYMFPIAIGLPVVNFILKWWPNNELRHDNKKILIQPSFNVKNMRNGRHLKKPEDRVCKQLGRKAVKFMASHACHLQISRKYLTIFKLQVQHNMSCLLFTRYLLINFTSCWKLWIRNRIRNAELFNWKWFYLALFITEPLSHSCHVAMYLCVCMTL